MPKYLLAPKAREDMEAVWLYSFSQWGMQQTETYIDDLTEALGFLAENPRAGTACDNIRSGYRKYPVIRHIVYYRETSYGIEVIRILHGHMLAIQHL
jgi:toxin ParE1/3/4